MHYQNPNIVAGAVAVSDGRILLCKRAIEPRKGFWTLPAGFMEHGETVPEAARRETQEEAQADISFTSLLSIGDIPHIGQVHIFYLGDLIDGLHSPGPESLETELFEEKDIPWNDLAFHSVRQTIEEYLKRRRKDGFDPEHPGDPYQFTVVWNRK